MSDAIHPPCPTPFNLAQYVLDAGRATPDKSALEVLGSDPQTWSYTQLTNAVRGVATGLLNAGFKPQDMVMLRLGNTPDFPIAYLGIIAAGMVAVPTSAVLTSSEITKMAAQIAPAAILQDVKVSAPTSKARSITLEDLQAMYTLPPALWHMGDPERTAYVVFTSGTSAAPRAVQHAHRAIWARKMMHCDWYDLRAEDRLLHAGAFNWTFTLGTGLMDPWSVGATALIPQDGTQPEALPALLAQKNATLFAAAPGIFRKLVRKEMPVMPKLRHALSAGEKMVETLHAEWQRATGSQVYEAFGMSECSTFISSSPTRPAPTNTLGRTQNGRRIAVIRDNGTEAATGDLGTIAVHHSDPGLMLGYLNAPDETNARFQGDWFMTGDLGRCDTNGAISYEGRSDDMLNAGGFRVSPLEIEAAFAEIGGLIQCAAIETTVKSGAQVIALCYTAQNTVHKSAFEALASTQLARYKQPRIYHRCDTLPSSANGKLLRRVLRAQIEALYG